MAGIIVREGRPEDARELLDYVEALIAEGDLFIPLEPGEWTLTCEAEEKLMRDYAASPNSVFLVAEEAGEIAGVLNLSGGKRKATAHAAELGMSVRRSSRGRGVGGMLLAAAIDWAKRSGVLARITLHVYDENPARRLYRRHGFVEEGRLRRALFRRGRHHDDIVMGLLLGDDAHGD